MLCTLSYSQNYAGIIHPALGLKPENVHVHSLALIQSEVSSEYGSQGLQGKLVSRGHVSNWSQVHAPSMLTTRGHYVEHMGVHQKEIEGGLEWNGMFIFFAFPTN